MLLIATMTINFDFQKVKNLLQFLHKFLTRKKCFPAVSSTVNLKTEKKQLFCFVKTNPRFLISTMIISGDNNLLKQNLLKQIELCLAATSSLFSKHLILI